MDTPGIGGSSWHSDIESSDDMVDILLPVLPEKAAYIGWSYGGLLNLALAAKYPERVNAIVNIASSPRFIEDGDWPGVPAPGFQASLMPDIKRNGLSAFLDAFIEDEFQDFNPKPAAYNEVKQYFPNDMDVDINAIDKRLQLVDQTDLRESFKNLTCPINLILGEHDGAVPSAVYEKIKGLNPSARLHVIPGARHMMFWTHPNQFNSILMNILDTSTQSI